MSKFKPYAERVNAIAKAAFDAYLEAAKKLKKAEERYNERSNPYNNPGYTPYELQARSARAKADMLEAQQALKDAQEFMQSETASIRAVGRELQEAIAREYAAKGEDVDLATLELMKSGILKPQEYFLLYETAQNNGNNTMMRLVGKYAGEMAANAPTKDLQEQLNKLSSVAQYAQGKAHIEAFNVLEDAFARTANNPGMIPHWGEITEPVIKNF